MVLNGKIWREARNQKWWKEIFYLERNKEFDRLEKDPRQNNREPRESKKIGTDR